MTTSLGEKRVIKFRAWDGQFIVPEELEMPDFSDTFYDTRVHPETQRAIDARRMEISTLNRARAEFLSKLEEFGGEDKPNN